MWFVVLHLQQGMALSVCLGSYRKQKSYGCSSSGEENSKPPAKRRNTCDDEKAEQDAIGTLIPRSPEKAMGKVNTQRAAAAHYEDQAALQKCNDSRASSATRIFE